MSASEGSRLEGMAGTGNTIRAVDRTSSRAGADRQICVRYTGRAACSIISATKNIQHTVRYTKLSPERFKSFWED